MKKFLLAASAAALTFGAAPALAQDAGAFTGPRVGVTLGTGGNNFIDFDNQSIGVDVGYDIEAGNNVIVGIGAEYQTDLGDDFFDVSETALLGRVGVKAGDNALVYGTGGYSRIASGATPFSSGEDGYRLGAGVEFGGPTSFKVEQRYTDYGNGFDGWQTVAGVTFRF